MYVVHNSSIITAQMIGKGQINDLLLILIVMLMLLQVHEKYAGHEEEWRYELRVRYIPTDLQDLYEKDKVTFYYYYDQVRRQRKRSLSC